MLGADHRDPVGDEHHSKQRHHDGQHDHTVHYGAGSRATGTSAIHPGIRSACQVWPPPPGPAATLTQDGRLLPGRGPLHSMPARQTVDRCRGTGGDRGSGGHGHLLAGLDWAGLRQPRPRNDESQPKTTQPVKTRTKPEPRTSPEKCSISPSRRASPWLGPRWTRRTDQPVRWSPACVRFVAERVSQGHALRSALAGDMRPRSADSKVSGAPMSSAASGPGGLVRKRAGPEPSPGSLQGARDQRPLLCADAPL